MLVELRDRIRTLFGFGLVALIGCAPNVEDAECTETKPCGRGEVCDLELNACVMANVDTTTTETPAPATFTGKPVPFFRGNVCTLHDVQAGAPVPVHLEPCFDACISSNSFHHKHYYTCTGTHCQAWAMMYVDANATACPADAFTKFDPARCVYDPMKAVDLSIEVVVQGEPVQGTMTLEIPYLSNADLVEIAANFDDTDLLREKIDQYPQEQNRIVGGMPINLSAASPAPPASCAGGACPCYQVGF
jgi:hypothetical protein